MNDRPTVLVRMADAGDVYVSWRWLGYDAAPGVTALPGADIDTVVRELAAALPDPNIAGGLERTLTTAAFAAPDTEYLLARDLSRALLPYDLAGQLHTLYNQGIRPLIRLQPSPRVAQVPWEILAPAPELRLIDIADIGLLAPAGIVHAPTRTARSWADTRELPVVAVLDPRVPGFRADSELGSVLGRMTRPTPLTERIADHIAADRIRPEVTEPTEIFRRTDLDREWLSRMLRAGAARLLYVGHVTAARPESGQSENTELHLACTADTVGFVEPQRTHRPLSAKDLLLGTHTLDSEPVAGRDLWPVPSRVALIACESGGDLRFTEALGLIAAMITGGAELVTATRWPLPTDLAFQRLGGATGATPLQEVVCAVDAAHETPDPLVALAEWQRDRLCAWRATGAIEDSPVLWSAFATFTT
ncbi:CHAT domain-containing protein [Nocardia jinanensis]|uniref:CHAT domain-containing protein n=1 Tax=Nocardia jinanensis TaxID=382504 RepID=A0A917W031_9NOCA|nr:CHAT domain-containing protein [Nocardia jinanensis]GGL45043.1 CHAT domain-containing protein [Nocardia jinanensis]